MVVSSAFTAPCAYGLGASYKSRVTPLRSRLPSRNPLPRHIHNRAVSQPRSEATAPTPEEFAREEQAKAVDKMRNRLEGLFGVAEDEGGANVREVFDGVALRSAIRERWGVEYDVQPQKRHGRVYIQVMWRYFEQQSFYMEEDEFASHCEAVAQLLQEWDAVEYFCDYIASIKKRPVVGITINIPIPGFVIERCKKDCIILPKSAHIRAAWDS